MSHLWFQLICIQCTLAPVKQSSASITCWRLLKPLDTLAWIMTYRSVARISVASVLVWPFDLLNVKLLPCYLASWGKGRRLRPYVTIWIRARLRELGNVLPTGHRVLSFCHLGQRKGNNFRVWVWSKIWRDHYFVWNRVFVFVVLLYRNCYLYLMFWSRSLFLFSLWQPTDMTEPNAITILLLCMHLYQRLPHYLPRATVNFEGPLHGTVTKHVCLIL